MSKLKGTPKSKTCPPDFKVEVSMRVWAAQNVPGVDIDFETDAFKDYEFPRSHSSWVATWRNWMREAYRRQSRYMPPKHTPSVIVADAEMEKLKSLRSAWSVPSFRDPMQGETVSEYRRAMSSASDEAKASRAQPRLFVVGK
jgi:hypothetical protein